MQLSISKLGPGITANMNQECTEWQGRRLALMHQSAQQVDSATSSCSRCRRGGKLRGVVGQAGVDGQITVVGLAAQRGQVVAGLAQRSAGAAARYGWTGRICGAGSSGQVL